jgi:hypothetical protein
MLYTRNDRGAGMSRLTIAGRWGADHSMLFQLRVDQAMVNGGGMRVTNRCSEAVKSHDLIDLATMVMGNAIAISLIYELGQNGNIVQSCNLSPCIPHFTPTPCGRQWQQPPEGRCRL